MASSRQLEELPLMQFRSVDEKEIDGYCDDEHSLIRKRNRHDEEISKSSSSRYPNDSGRSFEYRWLEILPVEQIYRLWTYLRAVPLPEWLLHSFTVDGLKQNSKGFAYAFVPQLFRTIFFKDPVKPTPITPTSWMNGLRGIAAFSVFNLHFIYNFTYTILVGWNTTPRDRYIHQLPIIYLVYDGFCSVVVFFTVAGYVCSYRPLQLMTNGDGERLFKALPASVFRRFFRLYLPIIFSTLLLSFLAYSGAYEPTRHFFNPKAYSKTFPGPSTEPHGFRFPTLYLQLRHWLKEMKFMTDFWTEWPDGIKLDFHLWTIVYEFRSSMQLYIALVALALCTPWARIFWLAVMGYLYAIRWSHWECLCFFYGAIIAQLDINRYQRQKEQSEILKMAHIQPHGATTTNTTISPSSYAEPNICSAYTTKASSSRRTRILRILIPTLRTLGYLFALYLMSFPMRGHRHISPLYRYTVNPFLPWAYGGSRGYAFPKQVGTLILMQLLTTVPIPERSRSLWHRCLTSWPALYLGRIMFALYILHGMVMHLIGYALPHLFWNAVSSYVDHNTNTPVHLLGLAIGWTISFIITLWAADVWTREVESRICGGITAWVERMCFRKA